MTFIFIEAIGAEDIPAIRKTAPDTYLVISVGSAVNSQKTKVFERSNRPSWNHQFSFILPSVFDTNIKCILFDYDDFRKDDSISELILSSNDFEYGQIYEKVYDMTSTRGLSKGGRLHLKIQIAPRTHKPFTVYKGKIPKSAQRKPENGGNDSDSSSIDGEEEEEEEEENNEKAKDTQSPNQQGQMIMIPQNADGSSFSIPLPSFSQAGMPNGYQAVVYIMPANQTPTPQTTWHIMNTPNQPQQPLSQTYNFPQQTSTTIQAMSQTQPIPQYNQPHFSSITTQPISISPTIQEQPQKPKSKSKVSKSKPKPKKRAKTSLKE